VAGAATARIDAGGPRLNPPLRIVPASTAQVAADPAAPCIAFFAVDIETVMLATAALGLGVTVEAGLARVVAPSADLGRLAAELERRGSELASRLRRYLEPEREWRLRTRALPLERAVVVGIVNLTDDSFSGDGVGRDVGAVLARAQALRADGADIIDVGAETARADRPVLEPGPEAELMGRAVAALAREGHVVSVDTYKREVAEAGLAEGAEVVNDISGLTVGSGAAEAAACAGAGYVLNYSYSPPKRRPDSPPAYGDVVAETLAWMDERLIRLRTLGLDDARVAIDPGIAFGKSHDEDLQVLRRCGEFTTLGLPLLIAHSRKNFIGSVTGRPPSDRDLETHVVSVLALAQGARIFRVHDVAGARRALDFAAGLVVGRPGEFAPSGESWPWRAGASAAHAASAPPAGHAPKGQRW
jgi:dihydropteroate synthase